MLTYMTWYCNIKVLKFELQCNFMNQFSKCFKITYNAFRQIKHEEICPEQGQPVQIQTYGVEEDIQIGMRYYK